MAFAFVTREDISEELNEKIVQVYPGDNFDFSGRGLSGEIEDLIHNKGLCVEACYTQADSGDWGTFLQASPDFKINEPGEDADDQAYLDHEANITLLGNLIEEWLNKFEAEIR